MRFLQPDEEVLLDARPHWWRLVRPGVVLVAVVGGTVAGFIGWKSAPVWFGAVLLGALVLVGGYCGGKYLAWRSTRLIVTTQRVVYRRGVLRRLGREIPIARVQDVTYRQRLGERLVGAGSITVESAGEAGSEPFPDIARPAAVQNLINQAIALATRPEPTGSRSSSSDVLEQIDHLGDLHRRGLLTDAEFASKKSELLGRV